MRNTLIRTIVLTLLTAGTAFAQQAGSSVLGTVSVLNSTSGAMEIQPDKAAAMPVNVTAATIIQRIAPGETSLKNAIAIKLNEIAVGDRVLVTLGPKPPEAVRVVVMSAGDIAKRDDAEHQDWLRRGVGGIVSVKSDNQIVLRTQQTITVSSKTKFRRYSPDSVSLADAKPGTVGDIAVGDQIRARGEKSADGLKVDAEDVIFGTFVTRAGSVTSIDPATREVTVKETGTGKSFIIKIAADSTIKQFPAGGRGQAPAAGANPSQLIDTLPAAKIDDIMPGTAVVVSSTKGTQEDKVTAILLVANADPLIRTATPSGRGGTLVFGSGGGGALDGLTLP
jgi:hypothetical protein